MHSGVHQGARGLFDVLVIHGLTLLCFTTSEVARAAFVGTLVTGCTSLHSCVSGANEVPVGTSGAINPFRAREQRFESASRPLPCTGLLFAGLILWLLSSKPPSASIG